MKVNAIFAGLLAVMSVAANAATVSTSPISAATTAPNGSSLYLEVFDASTSGANAGLTYFANLGVLASAFNSSTAQSWNLSADANNWGSFFVAGDTYLFNVVGGISTGGGNTFTAYGDYVTGGTDAPNFFAGQATVSATPINAPLSQITGNASNLNALATGSGVIAAGTASSWDVNAWDTLHGAAIFGNTNSSAGTDVANQFYHLGLLSGPNRYNTVLLGTFTLNTATGNGGLGGQSLDFAPVSAVPVPAAVWLFASSLVGLLTFGRRGNKA